jgi:hypothetical protein
MQCHYLEVGSNVFRSLKKIFVLSGPDGGVHLRKQMNHEFEASLLHSETISKKRLLPSYSYLILEQHPKKGITNKRTKLNTICSKRRKQTKLSLKMKRQN